MTINNVPNFNEEKAIATASLLLKFSGSQCDKYWLNKVMYFVERESIISTGQPIFFDRMFSVPFGPIVSVVNDAIDFSEYPFPSEWNKHISLKDKTVRLLEEADYDSLSEYEEELIYRLFKKFEGWGFTKLKDFFHSLPEYTETKSRVEINYDELLSKANIDEESIKDAIQNLSYLAWLGK
ncbi:MAG: Panacea domain-containing protein [Chloroflexi bacterium]|nr:Panacea domain-containing protein [Chloroflexota bacterium]